MTQNRCSLPPLPPLPPCASAKVTQAAVGEHTLLACTARSDVCTAAFREFSSEARPHEAGQDGRECACVCLRASPELNCALLPPSRLVPLAAVAVRRRRRRLDSGGVADGHQASALLTQHLPSWRAQLPPSAGGCPTGRLLLTGR